MSLHSPFFWMVLSALLVPYFLWRPASEKGRGEWRSAWMLVVSVGFVLANEPRALFALFGLGLVTYRAALMIEALPRGAKRGIWLYGAIAACLANLLLSKADATWVVFGVSFFTFQMIGYVIDVDRGAFRAERDLFRYFTSVSCFLYLSAGPVVRASELLPQLASPGALDPRTAMEGMFRIIWGLSKKTIGDLLGLIATEYFARPGSRGWLVAWTASLALAGQYYADFSGYSDIAIGLGRILGFRLPENFRTPYLATSVGDHWRRWHISLSEWFREYVFTPLCMMRWPLLRAVSGERALLRIALSLLVTMALIGIWHGLGWNNLLWGLYNGVLILVGFAPRKLPWGEFRGKKALAIALTFYALVLGRVLTCTQGLEQAWDAWADMHWSEFHFSTYRGLILVLVLAGLVIPHAVDHWLIEDSRAMGERRTLLSAVAVAMLVFILVFSVPGRPFLYEGY